MSEGVDVPARLRTLERDFGAMLRVPLDGRSGRFETPTGCFPPELLARIAGDEPHRRARLGVYHRQVWLRFFTVMQGEFPLTTRLLGAFALNRCVAAFIEQHPPSVPDLRQLGDGFSAFVVAWPGRRGLVRVQAQRVPDDALAESLAADDAYRVATAHRGSPPYRPTVEDARGLGSARFVGAPGLTLLRGRYGMAALRAGILADDPRARIALPPRAARPSATAVFATSFGVARWNLTLEQAELYELGMQMQVSSALERLADRPRTQAEEAGFGARVQSYVASGFERGLLVGLAPAEEATC